MPSNEVTLLLSQWRQLLSTMETIQPQIVAKIIQNNKDDRIIVPDGKHLIIDADWSMVQVKIQRKLCELLPEYEQLISAPPDLAGEWPVSDYVELHLAHYTNVLQRLERLCNKSGRGES